MPSPDQSMDNLSSFSATWFVPLVIYFDFKSILLPVANCAGPSNAASTGATEKHGLCSFALTVIDHQFKTTICHQVDNPEDCIKSFVRKLHDLPQDILKQKNKHPFYRGNRNLLHKSQVKQCWTGEKEFDVEDDPESRTDLDHCHFSGKILGWTH